MKRQRFTTGWTAVLVLICVVSDYKVAMSSDPLRELYVSMEPGQIGLPEDSAWQTLDSVNFLNPIWEGLFDSLEVSTIRFFYPRAALGIGTWASPNPMGIPRPTLENDFVLSFPSSELRDVAYEILTGLDNVFWAEKGDTASTKCLIEPNDPDFDLQWGLRNLNASGQPTGFDIGAAHAWETATGSYSSIVGVVGTGVYRHHEDFQTESGSRVFGDGVSHTPTKQVSQGS